LLIDKMLEPTEWVRRRTAPPVRAEAWVTHLFGGSARREGTAGLQMSGCLRDVVVARARTDCCRDRAGGRDRGEQTC